MSFLSKVFHLKPRSIGIIGLRWYKTSDYRQPSELLQVVVHGRTFRLLEPEHGMSCIDYNFIRNSYTEQRFRLLRTFRTNGTMHSRRGEGGGPDCEPPKAETPTLTDMGNKEHFLNQKLGKRTSRRISLAKSGVSSRKSGQPAGNGGARLPKKGFSRQRGPASAPRD